jgi:hypothetical protein
MILPLPNAEKELRIYLEILKTAVNDWRKNREEQFAIPHNEMLYVERELIVVFPSILESAITHLLL